MTDVSPRQVISRLPPDLIERLDAYAKRQEISRNAAVERLLAFGLSQAAKRDVRKPALPTPVRLGGSSIMPPPPVRVHVQVGPSESAPGSRLKKGKAK